MATSDHEVRGGETELKREGHLLHAHVIATGRGKVLGTGEKAPLALSLNLIMT